MKLILLVLLNYLLLVNIAKAQYGTPPGDPPDSPGDTLSSPTSSDSLNRISQKTVIRSSFEFETFTSGNGFKKDMFGMVLDYYGSDLNNLFTTSPRLAYDLNRLHGLLFDDNQMRITCHQPLIGFSSSNEPLTRQEDQAMLKAYRAENPLCNRMIAGINKSI